MYSQLAEDDDTYLSRLAGHLENAQQLYSDFSGAIIGIFNGMSARRIMTLESELEALDAATKKEIELAGDNDEAKRRIEERAEKRRESLNIKIKREQRRTARLAKGAAIIEATIKSIVAVLDQFSKGGYPAAIAAAAFGALQIAAIAAQPIPQFAKGIDSAPGGLAIVGERGQEIVREIGGRVSLTPDRPTLMHVPKGSEVIPHDETMRMLALSALGQETYTDREQARLISEIQDLKGTIKEYDSKIVKAIYANGGHLEKDGSILYRVTTDEQANRIRTRKSTMG
jgi:Skp family chaperone for outer membrane proteins